jgi:ketosteroid isomerase-like protein
MAVLLFFSFAAHAQILTTEVWLGKLDMREGFAITDLRNVSNDPGYDNQPAFFPDGKTMVYTSETTGLADTGLGLHAFLVDLDTGARAPLPGARGFSPTPTADGRNLMMLREGGVWLHGLDGEELRALTDTKTAGYYARFDDRTYVLFMNEKERRIVIYDARAKSLDTMATGANTAPYRVPGQDAVTFVAEEPFPRPENAEGVTRTQFLRRLDVKARKVTTLATIPFATGGQHLWTSRGTILMASGPAIYEWSPARPDEWKVVYRAEHPDLQGLSRIAINPKGDHIALVSVPRDETVLRESRAASNAALAARDAGAVAGIFARDGRVTAASGQTFEGPEAIEKALAEQFAQREGLVYVRTPRTFTLSSADAAASEQGTWSGHWTNPAGAVELHGEYMAVWRRTIGANGVPSWAMQSELFVAVECSGEGCASR